MRIAVIDGLGGGLGGQLVQQLRTQLGAEQEIWALGTNSLATQVMVKAGANRGATGENAIRVCLEQVEIVAGPLGIVIPNALMGEITPAIAEQVASSQAHKILVPVVQNHFDLMGLESKPLVQLLRQTVARVAELLQEKGREA